MTNLEFRIEWEDPGGARGDELRATWARLEIRVDTAIVTHAYDPVLNSVRTGIYAPLYPVAEWIVSNWWPLLSECQMPNRATEANYAKRHNLWFAREGFAMPSLEFRPTHGRFAVKWRQQELPAERINFIQEGAALVESRVVEESLSLFVGRVVERLDSSGVRGTPLQQDWISIRNQDAEEEAFCIAAGSMGLDPFDISEADSQKVLAASASLPAEIHNDFFEAANLGRLEPQREWVENGMRLALNQQMEMRGLKKLRDELAQANVQKSPWSQGYELAGQLRRVLGIADKEHIALTELSPDDNLMQALLVSPSKESGLDAITVINHSGSPGFIVRPGNELSQRFTFCRALFEFLHAAAPTPSLVSSAISEKQQRNRAFAAELLAPHRLIQDHMSSEVIDSSEVEELAARFAVSTYVIAHQIENHDLGEVL